MWLDVKITDKNGKTVFRSGNLDSDGNIDKSAVLFHTQLGDSKGEPVVNVALADRILSDHRVPPKGYLIEKYSFLITPDAISPLTVTATLKYRSASQAFANTLLGNSSAEIPVVDMFNLVDTIMF